MGRKVKDKSSNSIRDVINEDSSYFYFSDGSKGKKNSKNFVKVSTKRKKSRSGNNFKDTISNEQFERHQQRRSGGGKQRQRPPQQQQRQRPPQPDDPMNILMGDSKDYISQLITQNAPVDRQGSGYQDEYGYDDQMGYQDEFMQDPRESHRRGGGAQQPMNENYNAGAGGGADDFFSNLPPVDVNPQTTNKEEVMRRMQEGQSAFTQPPNAQNGLFIGIDDNDLPPTPTGDAEAPPRRAATATGPNGKPLSRPTPRGQEPPKPKHQTVRTNASDPPAGQQQQQPPNQGQPHAGPMTKEMEIKFILDKFTNEHLIDFPLEVRKKIPSMEDIRFMKDKMNIDEEILISVIAEEITQDILKDPSEVKKKISDKIKSQINENIGKTTVNDKEAEKAKVEDDGEAEEINL